MANPGSDEAIKDGCICPVLDNAHGKGVMGIGGVWVYVENCPVHRHELALILHESKPKSPSPALEGEGE